MTLKKRIIILAVLCFGPPLFVATALAPARANELPATVALSGPLVEEIFRALAARPYAEVAATIAKLQAEVQHPPAPSEPGPKAEPKSDSHK